MPAPKGHRHITERESAHKWPDGQPDDAKWEDCAWTSAVEFARLCWDPNIPASHAEAEALRDAAGEKPAGGSNTGDLLRGLAKRYNFHPKTVTGATAYLLALKPGWAGVSMGRMSAFPVGHELRRWDPGFNGAHATLTANTSGLWWCDPLAPQGVQKKPVRPAYQGESISKSDLTKFIRALGSIPMLIAEMKEVPLPDTSTAPVLAPVTDEKPAAIDLPGGSALYDLDGKTVLKRLAADTKLSGRYSPYGTAGKRAIFATIEDVRRPVLVKPSKVAPYTSASQAELNEAYANGQKDERAKTTEAVKGFRELLGL